MSTTTDELKACARRLAEEVWSQGDFAVAGELVSADYARHVPGDQPAPGLAGLKEMVTLMHHTFPDFHVIVEDEIAEGDRVVQRMTIRGTHLVELIGGAVATKAVSLCAIDINRAGPDGKFVEHWSSVDLVGLVQQIAADPTQPDPGRKPEPLRDQEQHR